MDLAGTEQAGACGWALNEGFKSGTTSKRESEMTKLFPNVSLRVPVADGRRSLEL